MRKIRRPLVVTPADLAAFEVLDKIESFVLVQDLFIEKLSRENFAKKAKEIAKKIAPSLKTNWETVEVRLWDLYDYGEDK